MASEKFLGMKGVKSCQVVCKSEGKVSEEISKGYTINEFMGVNFVKAEMSEGCRWRRGLGVTFKVLSTRWQSEVSDDRRSYDWIESGVGMSY